MAERFEDITPKLQQFIAKQNMFFVATAPLGGGRVNVSPKGYKDTFKVLDEHTFAYLELFGSGIETKAHLAENGRITVMFCSFDRESNIVRLYGTGRYIRPDDEEFHGFAVHFNLEHPGLRGLIVVDVTSTQASCGYSVPYMKLDKERPALDKRHASYADDQWALRVSSVNDKSIDGLPGLEPDHPIPPHVPRTKFGL